MTTVGLETVSPSALPTTPAGGQLVGNRDAADKAPMTVDLAADFGALVVAAATVAEEATMHSALMMVIRLLFMFAPPR
jgi:hypothetical protein